MPNQKLLAEYCIPNLLANVQPIHLMRDPTRFKLWIVYFRKKILGESTYIYDDNLPKSS